MKALIVLAISMNVFAATAKAESNYLDTESLNHCGGHVELRESDNGDLSLKFENLYDNSCKEVIFYDFSSNKVIKSYKNINGQTYTLSKTQRESLSEDCRLGVNVEGTLDLGFLGKVKIQDKLEVKVPSCLRAKNNKASKVSYEWSGNHNCKKMINNVYSNENVADSFCTKVSYEWSAKHNCKKMINNVYSNENVADSFCRK